MSIGLSGARESSDFLPLGRALAIRVLEALSTDPAELSELLQNANRSNQARSVQGNLERQATHLNPRFRCGSAAGARSQRRIANDRSETVRRLPNEHNRLCFRA
jgi:hypothetical protein